MKKNFNIIIVSFVFAVVIWISISLSNEYYDTIDVPLQIINFPEGFSFGTKIPETVSIKLKAKGWRLLGFNFSKDLEFIVSIGRDTGRSNIKLANSIPENSWITSDMQIIDLNPSALNIFIDKAVQKKIPVEVNFNLTFKDGFGLAEPIITEPDSILVSGSLNLIKNYSAIKTEPKSFFDLDTKFSESVSLKRINGIRFNQVTINAYVNVQRIVEKEFEEIKVMVTDLPPDRNILFIPSEIKILVRGGIEILGKLKKEDFNSTVKYIDLITDTTGSIIPNISIPQNIELVSTNPDKIKYIIKKF